jgi:hypothetical protein
MLDTIPTSPPEDPEIAIYVVSRDGVRWRDYDPRRDDGQMLHKRIVFKKSANDD